MSFKQNKGLEDVCGRMDLKINFVLVQNQLGVVYSDGIHHVHRKACYEPITQGFQIFAPSKPIFQFHFSMSFLKYYRACIC